MDNYKDDLDGEFEDGLVDIEFPTHKCPICDRVLDLKQDGHHAEVWHVCRNGCYEYYASFAATIIHIFDQEYTLWPTNKASFNESVKSEIDDEIEYWKEDYRYLARIMTGK